MRNTDGWLVDRAMAFVTAAHGLSVRDAEVLRFSVNETLRASGSPGSRKPLHVLICAAMIAQGKSALCPSILEEASGKGMRRVEMLSAFIECRLDRRETLVVANHIRECTACDAVVRQGGDFVRIEGARRRRSIVAFAIVTFLLLGAVLYAARYRRTAGTPLTMESLLDTTREVRSTEARLSGGFPWAPYQKDAMRTNDTAESSTPMRAVAVGSGDTSQPSSVPHLKAMARLLSGDAPAAAAMLGQEARKTNDPRLWSDLAAAHYTAAIVNKRSWELLDALVAVDRGLALAPSMIEGLFNRALILERLGLREHALDAWNRYLAADGGSAWAIEARAHASQLEQRPRPFKDELSDHYEALATKQGAAQDFVQSFTQDSRVWGETEVLARWAEAYRGSDASGAQKHLSVARSLGAAIRSANGDAMLARAVAAIENGSAEQRSAVASAHLAFRAGQRLFGDRKPQEAERLLTAAGEDFARGKSPVGILARYFAANTIFAQGRIAEARARLEQLLNEVSGDLPAARAQIQWQLGLCDAAQSRWGESLASFHASEEAFNKLGETRNASTMSEMLAEVYDVIGDPSSAWEYRAAALRELGRVHDLRLPAILGFLAQMAIVRGDWPTVSSLLILEIDSSKKLGNDALLADALLRRAMVRHRLNEGDAQNDMAEAQRAIGRLTDASVRAQMESREQWVAATLAPSASERIARLTDAIGASRATFSHVLPTLLLERARAYRVAGDRERAALDLETAIAALDSRRGSLSTAEQRWGVFHAAGELLEEAVDLSLQERDVAAALRYSDHARARTLLDALAARNAVDIGRIPEGVVVVEYAANPNRLVLFVARRHYVRAVGIPVSRDTLIDEVNRFQRALEKREIGATGRVAEALFSWLVAPILQSISPGETVVFVPDATVSTVAFAALKRPDGRYLIEDHPVIVAPSAASYVYGATTAAPFETRERLLLIANPASGRDPLPETIREISAIAPLYRSVSRLVGEDATVERFSREAFGAPIIHFAGHAISSEWRAEDTAIVMASTRGEDQRLDVAKIAGLQLQASPIVLLAACSTARGRVTPLEGTQSVARAFLAAGARTVVATLWPIDDGEAARFFPRIHKHLVSGASAAEAVRAAQIEAIHQSMPPSLWAAVQVVGS